MILSELPLHAVKKRLKGEGLLIQTGRFNSLIKTHITGDFLTDFYTLYQDCQVFEQAYVDFNLSLNASSWLHRFFRTKVNFDYCGIRPFQPLPRVQSMPLLEWAMNWCVSQHYNQCLVIHAAVVEKNGQAIIMPGTPGSGKSTLCAALVNLAGWRLLSDELTLIDLSTTMILPNPRPLSLKNKSIQIIKQLCPELYCSTIVKDTVKGCVALFPPTRESVRRVDEPARASLVVFPKFEPGAAFELNQLSKGRAFLELANHSFNYSTLGELGFAAIARQMETARCFELQYGGNLLDAVDKLEQLVNS